MRDGLNHSPRATQEERDNKMKSFNDGREKFCQELIELIRNQTNRLTNMGFTEKTAWFDCLSMAKMIVDELHDEGDVEGARHSDFRLGIADFGLC